MRRHTALALLLVAVPLIAIAGRPNKRLSDDAQGELLYQRHCQACHGADNDGHGPATTALVVPVPDLQGELTKANREDNATLVLDGKGAMPGFKVSFDRYDARRVLRYMQKLPMDPSEMDLDEDEPDEVETEEAEEEANAPEGGDLAP